MLTDVLGDGFTMSEALEAPHWNALQHASRGSVPLSPRAPDAARRWERPAFLDPPAIGQRRSTLLAPLVEPYPGILRCLKERGASVVAQWPARYSNTGGQIRVVATPMPTRNSSSQRDSRRSRPRSA
jgi:hypothetical protein